VGWSLHGYWLFCLSEEGWDTLRGVGGLPAMINRKCYLAIRFSLYNKSDILNYLYTRLRAQVCL